MRLARSAGAETAGVIARILSVGLTGGIASGKSLVTRELGRLGAIIIDADEIVHKLLRPGGAGFGPVLERFGREILDDEGRIDRRVLGKRVFADPRDRWALNGIVHPLVLKEEERLHSEIRLLAEDRVVVTDAALLVESGTHKRFDRLVVVWCSVEEQLRRLAARDGIGREEAMLRIVAQMPAAEKVKLAHYTIETSGSEDDTRAQARALFAKLQSDLEAKLG
jgi:dephospho-CoA kinase